MRRAERDGAFARIYGFSFEGHYYKLPRPVLFLVRDESSSDRSEDTAQGGVGGFDTASTGVEAMDRQFGSDIRVWAVDRQDIAVCLDLEIGTYDEVLLQSLIADQDESPFRSTSGAAASRGAAAARGAATFRGAASFRGAAVGPHQDR